MHILFTLKVHAMGMCYLQQLFSPPCSFFIEFTGACIVDTHRALITALLSRFQVTEQNIFLFCSQSIINPSASQQLPFLNFICLQGSLDLNSVENVRMHSDGTQHNPWLPHLYCIREVFLYKVF